MRKEPPWVRAFLAALGACGNVTRAAAMAGVDVTGPYNRRNRDPGFRAEWLRLLAEREARASVDPGMTAVTPDERVSVGASCDGAKLARDAPTRWSKQAEEAFLTELTATANVARAAAAAGFSAAAIYRRKARDRHFAAGWDAAIAVGRSRLEAHLLLHADRTFDPEAMPVAAGEVKVSVGEAISILKHKPASAPAGSGAEWECNDALGMSTADVEAVRERILGKLERIRQQHDRERAEAGWTRDGEQWIPPGWVKAD